MPPRDRLEYLPCYGLRQVHRLPAVRSVHHAGNDSTGTQHRLESTGTLSRIREVVQDPVTADEVEFAEEKTSIPKICSCKRSSMRRLLAPGSTSSFMVANTLTSRMWSEKIRKSNRPGHGCHVIYNLMQATHAHPPQCFSRCRGAVALVKE
jgi:hypothetical protein